MINTNTARALNSFRISSHRLGASLGLVIVVAFTLALAFAGTCAVAEAQADSGILRVTVVDARNGALLTAAKVNIAVFGTPFIAVGSSASDGSVGFTHIPVGRVRLICRKLGYEAFDGEIQVGRDEVISITLRLAPALDVIGSVQSRSTASDPVKIIGDRSLIRRVSPDLVDALRALGGVSVEVARDGLGAAVGLRGRDPSELSATLNGANLGSNAGVLAVSTDLLSQAAVDEANDSINFSTLSPSMRPTYGLDLASGGYGSSMVKMTSQATAGAVGFALGHSVRGAESALNGDTYADASGLTYRHIGTRLATSNYGKVAFAAGQWNFAFGDMAASVLTHPIATYFTGAVPAGLGPGETVQASTANPLAVATGPLGDAFVSLSVSEHRYSSRDDAASRLIFGVTAPQIVTDNARGYGFDLSIQEALSDKRSAVVSVQSDTTTLTSSLIASVGRISTAQSSHSGELDLSYTLQSNRRLHYETKLQEQSDSSGPVALWNADVEWEPTSTDLYRVSARAGRRPFYSQSFVQARGFAPATDATYDCAHGIIAVSTPGDDSAIPSIRGLEATWSHTIRGFSLSGTVYNEYQRGLLMTDASVPMSVDTISAPTGYLSALMAGYASIGGCGSIEGRVPQVYFIHNVAGESAHYSGIDLNASTTPLKNVTLEAEYATTSSTLIALDPRLRLASSPYVPGTQTPNVPLHAATLTADWAVGAFEFLANMQYVSANNVRNLPSYGVVSLAASRSAGPNVRITVLATNIKSAYAGAFVSPRYAVPLATQSGPPLQTLAAPLTGARLFVTAAYRFAKQ